MNHKNFSDKNNKWKRRTAIAFALCAVAILAACSSMHPPAGSTPTVDSTPTKVPLKVGLALGGGAARGFAHIGVIQVLEENGIKPDLVVGTSAGSLVGAIYATGKDGRALQKIAEDMDESTITDWTLPFFNRGGVLRGDAYARFVSAQVDRKLIEQAALPLGIVATNLQTGHGVLFQRGDIATAVRASSAVPGIFPPVKIAGIDYVDGGLASPVPVRFARQMGATFVIAVDISAAPDGESADGTLNILLKTFSIMAKSINDFELKNADIMVRPALVGVKSSDFTAKRRAIDAGRAAMLAELPRLKALLLAQ
ncbi:MAG: patatin-like phospholipase family protein [Cytophagales bacterium]|nr:patatin-like phospholipase family protein [Cytophagales bacterium]